MDTQTATRDGQPIDLLHSPSLSRAPLQLQHGNALVGKRTMVHALLSTQPQRLTLAMAFFVID